MLNRLRSSLARMTRQMLVVPSHNRIVNLLMAVVLIGILFPAVGSNYANSDSAPNHGKDTPINVVVSLSKPPALNEQVTVNITISSDIDAPRTEIDLVLPNGVQPVGGGTTWAVDLVAGQSTTLQRDILVTTPGNKTIAATARYQAEPGLVWGDTGAAHFNARAGRGVAGFEYVGNPASGAAEPAPGNPLGSRLPQSVNPDGTTNETAPVSSGSQPPADTAAAPGSQSSAAGPSPMGTLTINGIWKYVDRNGNSQPLKILVQILNSSNTLLAEGYSDWDGTYSFSITNPGQFKVRMYTYYRHTSQTMQAIRIIPNGADGTSTDFFNYTKTYFVTTGLFGPFADGASNIGTWYPSSGYSEKHAWWIYDDVQRRGFFYPYNAVPTGQSAGSRMPEGTTIEWTSSSTEGTYYSRAKNIHLEAVDAYSAHTILHEYGHNVHWNVYGSYLPVTGCPSPHYVNRVSALNCAWTEGWANFWSIAVLNDPVYKWGAVPPATPPSLNLETATWGTSTWDNGHTVEGRTAGALWDMLDSNNEGYDKATLPLWQIWDVVYTQNDDNFSQFWDAWKAKGYDVFLSLQSLYQNTINYNTAPTWNISLPNRTLFADQILVDTIYLPSYADDPDHLDSLLYYTVSSAPTCAGVTIDSSKYVNINPSPGCWGTYNVTLRVSDGISSDTDTFVVTVNPRLVYVPLTLRNHSNGW